MTATAGTARPAALLAVALLAWSAVWLGPVFVGCALIVAGCGLMAHRVFTVHCRDEAARLLNEIEMGG